jgi:glycine betaine/proline transport system substrate-binding protein
MENALSSNDIQVLAEEWVGRSGVWNNGRAPEGRGVGAPIIGATEGWYVPRYVVQGDANATSSPRPRPEKIADLTQYAGLFKDQEEPSKGRFTTARPAGPANWKTAKC